jgi:cell division protein FtsQ
VIGLAPRDRETARQERSAAKADRAAARRGRSPYKTGFFALAAVGAIAAVAWLVFGSRFLVVRSVQVTGTHLVPAAEVLAVAGVPDGTPLAQVNTGAVASRVDRIPQVQSAAVSRDWPDRLVIAVTERTPALAVPDGKVFDLVDPSGVVVQQAARRPAGLPLFVPSATLPGVPGVQAAAGVVRSLPAAVAHQVTSVTAPTADAVTLHLSGGVTVVWGSGGDAAQKARVLAILMQTHAHYYDVSAPGTAVTG